MISVRSKKLKLEHYKRCIFHIYISIYLYIYIYIYIYIHLIIISNNYPITCTKLTMETQIEDVKDDQSQQSRHRNDIFNATVFLCLNIPAKNVKKQSVSIVT